MIRLIILDVDGCLSDGKITYTHEGIELKNFHVRDGFVIKAIVKMGYEVAIITGRDSAIVTNRARELNIQHLFQGVKDKKLIAQELCVKLGIDASEVAAIGDDLNDLKLLQWVGKAFSPNDALDYIQSSTHVLERCGGNACVREMIEIILHENGDYERFVSAWV